jgi:hypothetical protein
MSSDIARHVQETPLVDTHEHQQKEPAWLTNEDDILRDIFTNYVGADLHVAGIPADGMRRLMDGSDPDIEGRFESIRDVWEKIQFTGYGEAVRIVAQEIYGVEEMTGSALAAQNHKGKALRQPGERLRLLRDVANLDHIQTDDFCWPCPPDPAGVEFFLYDLSWQGFSSGVIDPEAIHGETDITVTDIASLKRAIEAIFAKHAPTAVAVKSQHAYGRTLDWVERSDADAETALQDVLTKPGEEIDVPTRLRLGDWCWARGVEQCIEHDLPFKLHTGYYAGNDRMPVSRIPSGNLSPLLAKYLDAKFVLMHISYPYNDELVAMAKHYRNVWADMCWAWSIDPFSSRDFLRRCIHAVPINKVFAFGGDTGWPTSAVAYAVQARTEITRALEAEVAEGYMGEKEAMYIASRIMRDNQYECFEVEGTRAALNAAHAAAE